MAVLPMARRRGHRLLDAAGGPRGQVRRPGVADLQLRRPPDRQPPLLCGPPRVVGRRPCVSHCNSSFCGGFVWALSDSSRRVSARAVLLSGGIHAFPGSSDLKRNVNILEGRWWRTEGGGDNFPAGRSASSRKSLRGEEGSRESGLTALVQGGGGSSTRATTAPWPPARWRRPRPSPSSARCCRASPRRAARSRTCCGTPSGWTRRRSSRGCAGDRGSVACIILPHSGC